MKLSKNLKKSTERKITDLKNNQEGKEKIKVKKKKKAKKLREYMSKFHLNNHSSFVDTDHDDDDVFWVFFFLVTHLFAFFIFFSFILSFIASIKQTSNNREKAFPPYLLASTHHPHKPPYRN